MVIPAVRLLASVLLLLSVVVCSISKQHHRPQAITESDFNQHYDYVITVDPSNESAVDDKACHPPSGGENSSVLCKTLDHAFRQLGVYNSVMLYLASPNGTYDLRLPQNLTNQCDVGVYGNNSLYPLIPTVECKEGAGLSFTNSCSIVLSNVQFLGCGVVHVSTSRNFSGNTHPHNMMSFLTIRAGLYFYNCTDVKMFHVEVSSSYQATGVVMYDTDGVVEIESCIFSNNSVPVDGSVAGGGGFTVEFTYCKPGDLTCNEMDYDPKYKRNSDSVYLFNNCTFEENVANKAFTKSNFILLARAYHDATGRGGGLSVYLKGDAVNNSVSIVDSQFIRNEAVWGGGIRIQMSDNTINNSVSLLHCNFTENRAVFAKNGKYTGGGAVHVVITTHYAINVDKNVSRSKIYINSCNLKYNEAMEGGGMCIALAPENGLDNNQVIEISISNSSFEYNQARLGTAVELSNFPVFNDGFMSEVKFYDCNFSNNYVMLRTDSIHPAGKAAVYTSGISASFLNSAKFYNNTGSALVAIGTQVKFVGTDAIFQNNSGTNGGALALLGYGSILVGPKTNMTFINNSAKQYGGAIYNRYIANEDLKSNAACFLHYSKPFVGPNEWSVWFNFSGNTAEQDGCSIASTSVFPCAWTEDFLVKPKLIFHWNDNWNYKNSSCKNEIFTRPKNFTLRNRSLSDPIKFTPGRAFTLPLDAWDEFENNVTDDTVYSVSIVDGDSVAEVEPGYTFVAANYISLTGEPGNNITIVLETAGSRTMHVVLNLTILECPPGFIHTQREDGFQSELEGYSAKKTICECPPDNQKYRNLLKCSSREFVTKIHINYWYGPVNVSKKTLSENNNVSNLMGKALYPYRSLTKDITLEDFSIKLPESMDEVGTFLCRSRKGVLCGECLSGYAVAVNSPTYDCVACNLNSTTTADYVRHLFAYIALTYLPIIIIFIVIIFFKIKLASSAAAGFLLYAQTISSGYFNITGYSLLYVNAKNKAPLVVPSIYSSIYGIFNLESFAKFMSPFCLNEHFTTLDVLCLDYAIAAFPLVVIVVIFLSYKFKSLKCHCPRKQETATIDPDTSSVTSIQSLTFNRRRRRSSPNNTLIHALMAFLLLSYTKFSLASMRTVVINELFDDAGNTVTHRIYLAGQFSFSDIHYLFPYGFLAILILVFIVFLPPLLLLGPIQFIDWLTDKPKLSWLRSVWPSIAIHTFLDTFQGYKPNRRFFGGLYLLFRLFMYTTYSFTKDLITHYTFQQIIIFVFAILVSLLRPYTKEFFNYLDTLLFLNLGILNTIAIYTSEYGYSTGLYGLECLLVFLPLVYIICYVIWNRIRKRREYKILKNNLKCQLINPVRASCASESEERERLLPLAGESVNYSSDDPDDDIFKRAERGNRFRTANIHTSPPRRRGEIPKTVVSIPETHLSIIEEEENVSKEGYDSGIGRQSSSGGLDSKNSEN